MILLLVKNSIPSLFLPGHFNLISNIFDFSLPEADINKSHVSFIRRVANNLLIGIV